MKFYYLFSVLFLHLFLLVDTEIFGNSIIHSKAEQLVLETECHDKIIIAKNSNSLIKKLTPILNIIAENDISLATTEKTGQPIAHLKAFVDINFEMLPKEQTSHANYSTKLALNNPNASVNSDATFSDGALPGLVSGYDPFTGFIEGASGNSGKITFATSGNLIDPNSGEDILAAVLVYSIDGVDYLLDEQLKNHKSKHVFWDTTSSQFIIPNFEANRLSIWFNPSHFQGFSFDYSWINSLGIASLPAFYSILPKSDSPLDLTRFSVQNEAGMAILQWATKGVWNKISNIYEIEYAFEDGSFNTIAFLEIGDASIGNESFEFKHYNLKAGKHLYRLKQKNKNGIISKSKAVSIFVAEVSK